MRLTSSAFFSLSLSLCLPACLSVSVCLSVCLPACLPVSLSFCSPTYLCLSVSLPTCLPVCLSVYLSVCLPLCLVIITITMIMLSSIWPCAQISGDVSLSLSDKRVHCYRVPNSCRKSVDICFTNAHYRDHHITSVKP